MPTTKPVYDLLDALLAGDVKLTPYSVLCNVCGAEFRGHEVQLQTEQCSICGGDTCHNCLGEQLICTNCRG